MSTADPTSRVVRRAIRVVAHEVLADLAANVYDNWDGYPEIGENDWRRVAEDVLAIAKGPFTPSEYYEAYALLEKRAGEFNA